MSTEESLESIAEWVKKQAYSLENISGNVSSIEVTISVLDQRMKELNKSLIRVADLLERIADKMP